MNATRSRVAARYTHAVMQRLDEDRGPRGYAGIVLSLHTGELAASGAAQLALGARRFATLRPNAQPIDVIQLPTRAKVGERLYYRRVLVLETWRDPWAEAEALRDRLRAEQKDEPGNDYETLLDHDEPTTPLEADDRPNRPPYPF